MLVQPAAENVGTELAGQSVMENFQQLRCRAFEPLFVVQPINYNPDHFFVCTPCPHTRFAGQKNNLYNGKG